MTISYEDILSNMRNFRSSSKTDIWDCPAGYFFKVVFYFDGHGLLGTDNMSATMDGIDSSIKDFRDNTAKNLMDYSSINEHWGNTKYTDTAYNFLRLNGEYTRAALLNRFVIALSNLCADKPWYFQQIEGLGTLIEKEQKVFQKESKFDEEDGVLKITCLADSMDDRIGTLIEMYREICYNEIMKREVVPVNLRRFNMGIYVFKKFDKFLHGDFGNGYAQIYPVGTNGGYDSSKQYASYKYFELTGCEFNMTEMSKSMWGSNLDNAEGNTLTGSLVINVRNCREVRFNSVIGQLITDFLTIDLGNVIEEVETSEDNKNSMELARSVSEERVHMFEKQPISTRFGANELNGTGTNGISTGFDENLETYVKPDNITVAQRLESEYNPYTGSLLSGISKLASSVFDAAKLPTISSGSKHSLLKSGTVYKHGPYEWIKYVNLNGLVGNLGAQAISEGLSKIKQLPGYDQFSSLTMGNLRGESVNSVLSGTMNILNGDIIGTVKNTVFKHKNSAASAEDETSLEGKNIFPNDGGSTKSAMTTENIYPKEEKTPEKITGNIYQTRTKIAKASEVLPAIVRGRNV